MSGVAVGGALLLLLVPFWASAAEPALVKDLLPGGAARDSALGEFARQGRFVYFAANDGVNGAELWRTDGT
ncbi:MAG TPA: hypothetical protein VLH41_07630, partial [Thermoanaerobaculia bacterium]|nr:hypothetical protein [Thermoanaerobaculia bacterium]